MDEKKNVDGITMKGEQENQFSLLSIANDSITMQLAGYVVYVPALSMMTNSNAFAFTNHRRSEILPFRNVYTRTCGLFRRNYALIRFILALNALSCFRSGRTAVKWAGGIGQFFFMIRIFVRLFLVANKTRVSWIEILVYIRMRVNVRFRLKLESGRGGGFLN